MANPRRRRIIKISEQAAEVAQAANNKEALEVAVAIARGCQSVEEANAELARVAALCAPKPKVAPVAKPVAKPKAKPKAKKAAKPKGVASRLKKALSKDED